MNWKMNKWQFWAILVLCLVLVIAGVEMLENRPVAVWPSLVIGAPLAVSGILGILFVGLQANSQQNRERQRLLSETQTCPTCSGSGRVKKEEGEQCEA